MSNPRADVVSEQYDRWRYPEPIADLQQWSAGNWQWFDPRYTHRLLWPDRPYRPDLDILIAGCGTNQAAAFAYSNPDARVVGIDVSGAALAHEEQLKRRHQLSNLQLELCPIEDVAALGGKFDLVVSSGVLHHLADPQAGMDALARVLRPEGALGVMLYARYGRVGVELLQSVFRDLGLGQDDESLRIVKEALATLPPGHLAQPYFGIAPDLDFDAGLVDTFLHGRERSYAVDDCLELVDRSGLVFVDWLFHAPYYPPRLVAGGQRLYRAIEALPPRQMWSVMERLRTVNACHYFIAGPDSRAPQSYRIDFGSLASPDYVVHWRVGAGMDGDVVYRTDWRLRLRPRPSSFARLVDGHRSVGDIAEVAEATATPGRAGSAPELDRSHRYARRLFEALWRLDFIEVELPAATPPG